MSTEGTVNIQVQRLNGQWETIQSGVENNPQIIQIRFREAQNSPLCSNGRVRAIDENGRLVDIT